MVQTAVLYAGAPLSAALVLGAAVYAPTVVRSARYRPGRAWDKDPVWFVPHADVIDGLPAANRGQKLTGGPATMIGSPVETPADELVGGASGEW